MKVKMLKLFQISKSVHFQKQLNLSLKTGKFKGIQNKEYFKKVIKYPLALMHQVSISQTKNFFTVNVTATSILTVTSMLPLTLLCCYNWLVCVGSFSALLGHRSLQINIRCFSNQVYLTQKLLRKTKNSQQHSKRWQNIVRRLWSLGKERASFIEALGSFELGQIIISCF